MSRLNLLYNSNLPNRAITVYLYLHDHANKQGECWPSLATMGKEIKMSRTTLHRAIKDLKNAGFLKTEQRYRENGGHSSLCYKLKI